MKSRSYHILFLLAIFLSCFRSKPIGLGIVNSYRLTVTKGSQSVQIPRGSEFEILATTQEKSTSDDLNKNVYLVRFEGEEYALKDAHTEEEFTAILFVTESRYAVVAASDLRMYDKPSLFSDARSRLEFTSYYKILGRSPDYYDGRENYYNWLQILLPDGKIGYIQDRGIQESEDPQALLKTGYLRYPSNGWIKIADPNKPKFIWKNGVLKPFGTVPRISLGVASYNEIVRTVTGDTFYRIVGGTDAYTNDEYSITDTGYKFYIAGEDSKVYLSYLDFSLERKCWKQPEKLTEAILKGFQGQNIDLCNTSVKSFDLPIGRVFYVSFFLRSPILLPANTNKIRNGVGKTVSDFIFIPGKDGYYSEQFHNKEIKWVDFDQDGLPELFVKGNVTRAGLPDYSVYEIRADRLVRIFQKDVSPEGCSTVEVKNRKLIYIDSCGSGNGGKDPLIREAYSFSKGKFVKE